MGVPKRTGEPGIDPRRFGTAIKVETGISSKGTSILWPHIIEATMNMNAIVMSPIASSESCHHRELILMRLTDDNHNGNGIGFD